jgi:hypothetical protein
MPLTQRFHNTVVERARTDRAFRASLVKEATLNILGGRRHHCVAPTARRYYRDHQVKAVAGKKTF